MTRGRGAAPVQPARPPQPNPARRPARGRSTGPAQAAPQACARCEAARRPAVAPCDLSAVALGCAHGRTLTWQWNQRAGRAAAVVPAVAPLNHFDVVAEPGDYVETIRVVVAMAVNPHLPTHPEFILRGASDGTPQVRRGGTRTTFTVHYRAWWREVLAQAQRGNLLTALRSIFFPEPRRYEVQVVTCGARAQGRGWGRASLLVFVHPSDKFKLSMSFPSLVTRENAYARGTVGEAQFQERQRSARTGRSEESRGVTVWNEGNRTTRVSEQSSANRVDGVSQTITQSGGARRDVIVANPATTPAHRSALRGIKLEREQADVSTSFQLSGFADAISTVRSAVTGLFEFFRAMADAFPEIGWRMSWGLELLSGSLALEWGWKENPSTNRAWRWVKVGADLTLLDVTFTISFGARVLRAVAKIELELNAKLEVASSAESTPSNAARFAVVSTATGQGTLRAVAGWRDTLTIEGNVRTGLELTSRMTWNPSFSWTLDAKLKEGKGSVITTVFGFERDSSWTFWNERPLMRQRSLVG